ncbi:MAG: ABC transporter permease [Anaerolineaceae bacterium]|nr:ABC transporter permease [Anaerolineaceae bacterium]MDE0329526.1 ABC transporter permease [Anaerolineaceae bacterium]
MSSPVGTRLETNNVAGEAQVSPSLLQLALRRLWRDRLSMAAIGMLLFLTLLCFGAPVINFLTGTNSRNIVADSFLPPLTPGHILGTDDIGRDHLARLLEAGQVSLSIGFLAALMALAIGVTVGLLSGFIGGHLDDGVIWFITTLNSIPLLFIILLIAAFLSPNATTLILALGLFGWTGTARLVRGEAIALREREFIISARASGAGNLRLMFAHVLPNQLSIILINLAIDIGIIILVEATLSFLGFGVQPPQPTWGNMLTESRSFMYYGPHLVFWPGFLIFVTVLCLYVLGDGLRDAFDPTTID